MDTSHGRKTCELDDLLMSRTAFGFSTSRTPRGIPEFSDADIAAVAGPGAVGLQDAFGVAGFVGWHIGSIAAEHGPVADGEWQVVLELAFKEVAGGQCQLR
jgi:hypothetical protein